VVIESIVRLLKLEANARGLARTHTNALTIATDAALAGANHATAFGNTVKAEVTATIGAGVQLEGAARTVGHFDLHFGVGNSMTVCINDSADDLARSSRCRGSQRVRLHHERRREQQCKSEKNSHERKGVCGVGVDWTQS